MFDHLINKTVIIRSSDSGVHFGTLLSATDDARTVRLKDSRRLWRWAIDGQGISLSEVSILGVKHSDSKITMTLPDIIISDCCEIIPCDGVAAATIIGAPIAQAE